MDNRAYSGAQSGMGSKYGHGWSGLLWQVSRFLEDRTDEYLSQTLIGLQSPGANDFIDGKFNASYVAGNIGKAIQNLVDAGARNVFVLNIGDLSVLPVLKDTHPDTKKGIQRLVVSANRKILRHAKEILQKANSPMLKLAVIDLFSVTGDAAENLELKDEVFSFKETDIDPGEQMLFGWVDDVHPSTVVHRYIADRVYSALVHSE